MKEKEKGKFIALEGPDGCGKSTQVSLLTDWLEEAGNKVIATKEPTKNPIGQILRSALQGDIDLSLEAEALLFASDRAQHVHDVIQPGIEEGKTVVTGRYVYSSLAYQSSRGLPQKWVEKINETVIKPDLTVFIDIPSEVGLKRKNSSRKPDEFEKNLELQKKVRKTYQKIAEDKNIPVIDGTMSKEKVHEEIRNKVKDVLPKTTKNKNA